MRIVKVTLVATILMCIIAVSIITGVYAAWNNNPDPTPEQAPTTPPENDPIIEPEEPAKNILVLGKTELEVGILVGDSIKEIDKDTAMFGDNLGWTPGQIKMISLGMTNNGDADVDFSIGINVIDEKAAVNTAGEEFYLSDYIQFALIKGTDIFAGEVVGVHNIGADYISAGPIKAESNLEIYTLALTIPEDVAQKVAVAEGGEAPDIELGLIVLATTPYGPSLDDMEEEVETPTVPEYFEGSESVENIVVDGVISEPVTIGGGENSSMSAVVPEGVKLEEGVTELTFSVTGVEESEANVELETGKAKLSLDIHVEGVAADNDKPIIVAINDVFPKNLTNGNISLYHVENGETITMTQVDSADNLDAHDEFYYDFETGNITLALASFSEVVATFAPENPWNGTDVSYEWYNTPNDDGSYTLKSTADLRGFAQIVGGMATGIDRDSFSGKTVKLGADMNLGGHIFEPIGYYYTDDKNGDGTTGDYYSSVYSFEGIFNGCGHTVSNFYQNTWEIKGDYDGNYYKDGMGLFGYILNGTVQSLVINNFQSDGEFTPTGCVTAYACNSTFNDITVMNSNPRVYNTGNGGIVGIGGNNDDTDSFTLSFNNIIVDNTNKISALWGSWDVGCGGIIGMYRGSGKVNMTNCDVACEIDVFNDVCGNYQYYQYRYSGMLIGTVGRDSDPSDEAEKFYFKDCYVSYGDWVNHYYCELVANSLASYTHDHQMSRLEKIDSISEISDNGGTTWKKTGNYYLVSGDTITCYHIVNKDGVLTQHKHEDSGHETTDIDGDGVVDSSVLKEDKQLVAIKFKQLYTGYGWGATPYADGVDVTEYIYSITYINDNKVLATTYVGDNTSVFVLKDDPRYATAQEAAKKWVTDQGYDVEFGGWVNAGSTKVTEIPAGNTENIKLYPYFNSPYTARFVDQNGNILAWCLFHSEKTDDLENTRLLAESKLVFDEGFSLDHWEVHITDDNGNTTTKETYASSNFASYTTDVTVYPVYKFNGDVNLIPVDGDGDGDIDYYQVGGYGKDTGEQELVEVPGMVNGVPVTTINADAFSSYDDLHSVRIPGTITTINSQSFTANQGSSWNPARDTVTLYYEGTPEQMRQYMDVFYKNKNKYVEKNGLIYETEDSYVDKKIATIFMDSWDNNMGNGSRIFFLDANGKVDNTKYWELNSDFVWVYHEHAYSYEAAKTCALGEESHFEYGRSSSYPWNKMLLENKFTDYDGKCDCDSCNGATRPDADYWTWVVTFDDNDDNAETNVAKMNVVYGQSTLALPAPAARDGYTFAGWSDGTNTYAAGATFTPSSDVTLVAQWTEN